MDKPRKHNKSVYRRRRITIVVALLLIVASAAMLPRLISAVKEPEVEDVLIGFSDSGTEAASNSAGSARPSQQPEQPKPETLAQPGQSAKPTAAPTTAPTTAPASSPAAKTPAASAKVSPSAEPDSEPDAGETADLPYYLYVEKGSFTLTIYEKDADGEYTKVHKTYRIAHGGNKTPAGKFTLGSRERWHEFPDGGFVQYAVRYHARLYAHSPLYGAEDAKILWPKYYDGEFGIGKESTGGCLRMVTEAARFIYENCPEGTVLEIVNGSPKGTSSGDVPSRNGKRVDPTDVNVN